jgi:hypothetical protein
MSDEQCAEPSQDAGAAAEQPWAEGYDMSPMRRDEALTYCVFADPHCGIASAPLPSTERGQHLATLAVWAPRITPTSQAVFTRYPAPFCPQADSAGSPHLKIMGELTVSIAHEICQPLLSIASNGKRPIWKRPSAAFRTSAPNASVQRISFQRCAHWQSRRPANLSRSTSTT